MDQIGVRELRQNASVYLRRVKSGESLEITEHGKPVAMIVPVPMSNFDRMVAEGIITMPTSTEDLLDIEPIKSDFDISGELARLREDER